MAHPDEADPKACGRWGAHTNPGSNCELNAIVATLSTGPVGIADKPWDTNATLVRRCVRDDGRILQPDKPATAVDSMFVGGQRGQRGQREQREPEGGGGGGRAGEPQGARRGGQADGPRQPPLGHVWATATTLASGGGGAGAVGVGASMVWHYVLSVDVKTPWRIHGDDFYPKLPAPKGAAPSGVPAPPAPPVSLQWVARPWFTGHGPTRCVHGAKALGSRCITASVAAARDVRPKERQIQIQA